MRPKKTHLSGVMRAGRSGMEEVENGADGRPAGETGRPAEASGMGWDGPWIGLTRSMPSTATAWTMAPRCPGRARRLHLAARHGAQAGVAGGEHGAAVLSWGGWRSQKVPILRAI